MTSSSGQYGNDYLDGGEGDDVLWGDDNRDQDNKNIAGDDTLKGGSGSDKLYGGLGFDTYLFDLEDIKTANDGKIIKDKDNKGRLVIDGLDLTNTVFFKVDENSNVYENQDGQFTLIHHGDSYTLTGTAFNASITIQDTPTTKDGENDVVLGMILSKEVKNTAPIVQNPISDQMLLAGQDITLSLGGAFFDAEDTDDKLIYNLQGIAGTGLHFDPTTKILTGKAPEKGTFNLTLTATDPKGEHANTNFTLRVNERPTLVSALTLPAVLSQADATTKIGIDKLFVDNDGDALNYTLSAGGIQGIYLDETNHLVIDPSVAQIGTHHIMITATDTFGQSVSTNASFTIKESVIASPTDPITPIYTQPTIIGKWQVGTLGADNLMGDDKANMINGLSGDDTLYGGHGNDTLIGDLGHDILIGGQGNDLLIGGFGNDTYLYQKGDGLDTIRDVDGLDILKLSGLTLSDLGFTKQGKNLFINTNLTDSSTNEGILIEGYFKSNSIITNQKPHAPNIERIYINDELVGHEEIVEMVNVII